MTMKLVVVWFLGGLLMLGGSWVLSNLEYTVGVTNVSYFMAIVASLAMFLLSGLCWISVAVATKGKH